ncbi:hypothetical protein EW145_g5936, partial [Phellinidium pouzarii]
RAQRTVRKGEKHMRRVERKMARLEAKMAKRGISGGMAAGIRTMVDGGMAGSRGMGMGMGAMFDARRDMGTGPGMGAGPGMGMAGMMKEMITNAAFSAIGGGGEGDGYYRLIIVDVAA